MSPRMLRLPAGSILAAAAGLLLSCFPFSPARAQTDANWSGLFGLPGTDAEVTCSTIWRGNLVVGGSFGWAGITSAPCVALWNGTAWSALGAGFDGRVEALAVWNDTLFAAGAFTTSGNVDVYDIARWDGAGWTSVGGGTDGEVTALLATQGGLVAGGSFGDMHTLPGTSNIARWNGTSWSTLGGGLGSTVRGLALHGGQVAAVGEFDGHVALFDGSNWNTVGGGIPDAGSTSEVGAVISHGGQLYVGGSFDVTPNGEELLNVGRWNGSAWQAVGSGLDGTVQAFAEWNGNLYIGGMFMNPVFHIAMWDGLNLGYPGDVFGVGWNGGDYVNTIAASASRIYIGGVLTLVWPSTYGSNVFGFDGAAYSPLGTGNGLDGNVGTITRWNGSIVAGGSFTRSYTVGGLNGIARWNGARWAPLGTGLQQGTPYLVLRVDGMTTFGTDLVACGQFTAAGGSTVNNIARWNGTSWSAFGGGFESEIWATAVYAGELWAAGGYHELQGNAAGALWKWTGSAWQAMANDVTGFAFTQWNGRLVLGGSFGTVAGVPANCVAQWDGADWSALGAGFDGTVLNLAVYGGDLYASGEFYHSGATAVAGIARWNGSQWVAVGGALETNWAAGALAPGSGALWAGGSWDHIGAVTGLDNVARWDGSAWTPLGSGTFGPVLALCVDGTDVWAGGMFSEAGHKLALHVSRWSATVAGGVPPAPRTFTLDLAPPSPNPGAGTTRIAFTLPDRRDAQLTILDVAGRRIATLANGTLEAGPHSIAWDGTSASRERAAAGIYWAVLTSGGRRLERRLVRLR